MASVKGGRGHKAPYDSTLIKIPKPIKNELQMIANHWRLTGNLPNTGLPLSREMLEAEAKKLTKKKDLPTNWQAFIDRILEMAGASV